jgi:uncharacterized protein YaiI (UPF0178 family)
MTTAQPACPVKNILLFLTERKKRALTAVRPQAVRNVVGQTLQKPIFLRTTCGHGAVIVGTWW